MTADVPSGGKYILQVGRTVFIRRGTDCDELDGAMSDSFLDGRREAQPACGLVARHHRFQTRLVDGNAALVEDADLIYVDIQTEHVVANLGKTGARNETDITGADNGDFHDCILKVLNRILPCAWADRSPNRRKPGSAPSARRPRGHPPHTC